MIIYSEHTYSNYLGFVPMVEDHRRKIAKLNEELHKTVAFCYLIILIDWFLTLKKKKKVILCTRTSNITCMFNT